MRDTACEITLDVTVMGIIPMEVSVSRRVVFYMDWSIGFPLTHRLFYTFKLEGYGSEPIGTVRNKSSIFDSQHVSASTQNKHVFLYIDPWRIGESFGDMCPITNEFVSYIEGVTTIWIVPDRSIFPLCGV